MINLNRPLNFSNHKFRASSAGKLMIDPVGGSNLDKYNKKVLELKDSEEKRDNTKNKETKTFSDLLVKIEKIKSEIKELELVKDEVCLSETTISYLVEIFLESLTGRRNEIFARAIEKGIQVESKAIDTLCEYHGMFYIKNSERKYNEFIQGECDIDSEDNDEIIDIKSSYDLYTFFARKNKPLDKIYEWQLRCYMELYFRNKSRVAFVLENTPDGIIQDEFKRLLYKLGTDKRDSEIYAEGCAEIRFNMEYDDIPIELRVIEKFVERDQQLIEKLYSRIVDCRKWLNDFAFKYWISVSVDERKEDGFILKDGSFVSFEELGISVLKKPKCEVCESEDIRTEGLFYECNNCGNSTIESEPEQEPEIIQPEPSSVGEIVEEVKEVDFTETSIELTPETKEESQQLNEMDSLIEQIEQLKSENECISFYKKNQVGLKKFPIALSTLEIKKRSFKADVNTETKPDVKVKSEPKQEPEQKPKQESKQEPELSPELSKINDLVKEMEAEFLSESNFDLKKKIPLKVRQLYIDNKEIVDSNKSFFNSMTKIKQAMEIAIKKIEISNINL